MHTARSGDRNVVGGDRHLPDRGIGLLRRGDRYTTDRWNVSGGASLTDPSVIPGLKVWLKADSTALADGASVAAWNDSSANGYNLNQGVAPTFKTNIVNGKPVLRFNGTSQYLNAATDVGIPQPNTVFAVVNADVTATNCSFYYSNGVQNMLILVGGAFYMNSTGGAGISDALVHSGAFHIFTGIYNAASSAGYVDGALVASGNVSTGGVGAVNIMHDIGAGTFGKGDYAEFLIYNTALSTANRQAVERYLGNKYAIAVTPGLLRKLVKIVPILLGTMEKPSE